MKKLASSAGDEARRALLASLRALLSSARQHMEMTDLAQLWKGLVEHREVPVGFWTEALLQTLPGLPKGPLRVRCLRQLLDSYASQPVCSRRGMFWVVRVV